MAADGAGRVRRRGAAAPPPLPAFVWAAAVARIRPSGAWVVERSCVRRYNSETLCHIHPVCGMGFSRRSAVSRLGALARRRGGRAWFSLRCVAAVRGSSDNGEG